MTNFGEKLDQLQVQLSLELNVIKTTNQFYPAGKKSQ